MLQYSTSFFERCESFKCEKEKAEQWVFVKVATGKEAAQAWGWPVAKTGKSQESGEFARVVKGN